MNLGDYMQEEPSRDFSYGLQIEFGFERKARIGLTIIKIKQCEIKYVCSLLSTNIGFIVGHLLTCL